MNRADMYVMLVAIALSKKITCFGGFGVIFPGTLKVKVERVAFERP
jgi:hypothetical protein